VSKTYRVFAQGFVKRKCLQNTWALKDVTLSVPPRKFVSIIGPSGCGKTTLLRIIGGLIQPDAGDAWLDGQVLNGPSEKTGMVFQHIGLLPGEPRSRTLNSLLSSSSTESSPALKGNWLNNTWTWLTSPGSRITTQTSYRAECSSEWASRDAWCWSPRSC